MLFLSKGTIVPDSLLIYSNAYYGKIPINWCITSIQNIGEIITGNTPSKKHEEYYNGNYPFFKPTDLTQGKDLISASETLTELGWKVSRYLPKGSILVNSIGNIGTVGLLQVDGAFNQQINGIIPFSFIHNEFLFWLLQNSFVQQQMLDKASATTIPILNKTKFCSIKVALPNLSHQKKISSTINKIFLELEKIE